MAKANVKSLIQLAEQYIGTPYQWGGESPKTGFDCSGFVQWLYGQQGITLPRTTYQQVKVGQGVPKANLRPGDILFFEPTKAGPAHEGLYIGGGKFIESPHTGASVRISSLAGRSDFVSARRIIASSQPSLTDVVNTVSKAPAPAQDGSQTGIVPPPAVATPVDQGVIGSTGVQMPGSVDYQIDPTHVSSLWQTVASSEFVSPDTQQMLQNAQMAAGTV